MNPKKVALAVLAAPALLVAVPALASADTGYRDCTTNVTEHAGADGANQGSENHCTNSFAGSGAAYGYGRGPAFGYGRGPGYVRGGGFGHRSLLGGLLGGIL
jgi:hypothetical protein